MFECYLIPALFLFLFVLAFEPRVLHAEHTPCPSATSTVLLSAASAAEFSPAVLWKHKDSRHLPSSSAEARLPSMPCVTQ